MNFKREKPRILNGWLLAVLLICQAAQAKDVAGLYEIELVANSQSPEDRTLAIKQALFAVLDRVLVANEDISKLPVVQQMLASAQNYVKQFQFSLMAADDYSNTDARLIRVEFDEQQLLEVIRNSPAGIWSEIRPETLLWLVIDEDGERKFYNADNMPDIESALALASKVKGLPLIFPMLDLEEQQKISVSEVLSADSRNLLAVSARYDVPAIMSGRLLKKGDCWQGEWAFYFDGKIKQWSTPCSPIRAATQAGVKGAYDVLSNYYGVKPQTVEK